MLTTTSFLVKTQAPNSQTHCRRSLFYQNIRNAAIAVITDTLQPHPITAIPSLQAQYCVVSMAIDLRSDTLTKPTQAMRAAMAAAVLGDDVYGEDPEVNELQATAARLLGKEAGLFVPSGTMGNLLAMMAHCHSRGMEVLLGDESHIYNYEAGGAASVGGLVFHVIPTADNGQLPLPTLQKALRNRPNDPHCPKPGVLCLENTHNRCGGAVLPLDYMANVAEWAAMHNLPIHLDGARVFNAAVALGVPVSDIAQHVTTVSFCLSKVPAWVAACRHNTHTTLSRVCAAQLGACSWVRGTSSAVPTACARCSGEASDRQGCWLPPGCLPCVIWLLDWQTTTPKQPLLRGMCTRTRLGLLLTSTPCRATLLCCTWRGSRTQRRWQRMRLPPRRMRLLQGMKMR